MTYGDALLLDLGTVFLCIALMARFARLSHSHPATIYLVFHVYTFTWRLFGLSAGAETLFSQWGPAYAPVTEEEIVHAVFFGDAALSAMTCTWLYASSRSYAKAKERPPRPPPWMLREKLIWAIVIPAIPFAIFGYLRYNVSTSQSAAAAVDVGAWGTSSYLWMLQAWPGLLLLALIYYYGFRKWLIIPMVAHLAIMAFQGYHRYRVIIPLILLVQIHLDRHVRRWPRVWTSAILLAGGIAFFPMKTIGRMLQNDASISEIADASLTQVQGASRGEAQDQEFLDELACTLSLADASGTRYWGSTYLALVTLPIPRQWWPEKPGLADYIKDLSRPWRPMDESGMVVTYIGELYANFGYLGILLGPCLVAYALARAYYAAYRRPYGAIFHFAYLLVACNLVQVFRDGLISLAMFTVVNMMPLVLIVLLHVAYYKARGGSPRNVRARTLRAQPHTG